MASATTVSDSELEAAIREALSGANLETITPKSIRKELEEKFETSLRDKRRFIKELITTIINEADDEEESESEQESEVDDEEAEDGESEEEEEPKPKRRGGFQKLMVLAPALAELLGEAQLPRTQVSKMLVAYIKKNELQSPKDGRVILLDEKLQLIFKRKTMSFFSMNKFLSPLLKNPEHMVGRDQNGEWIEEDVKPPAAKRKRGRAAKSESKSSAANKKPSTSKKRAGSGNRTAYICFSMERRPQLVEENPDMAFGEVGKELGRQWREFSAEDKQPYVDMAAEYNGSNGGRKQKRAKKASGKKSGGGGGLQKPLRLSDELAAVLGVSEMSRPQVVKALWVYIKANELQNPENKRQIFCDAKLGAVLGEQTDMFKMNKTISAHLFPIDE